VDKPIVWLQGEVRSPPFSEEARREAGYLLRLLQRGNLLSMPYSRQMPSIGRACHELRVRDRDATWRIVYHLADEAVVILDVFSKKTQSTPTTVIKAAKARLTAYRKAVREEG